MFNKYTINNLAQGTVNTILTAGATSLILSTGQGALFPTTFPFILKLEGLTTGNVVRREIVKVTNRVGDTLTIVRSFETCPANYTAVTQTNTAFQFEVGDIVSLVITKEAIVDIQTEVTRLEGDKLNKSGALRTGLGSYKIIYTSPTGVETELPLGANNTFLKSNGATSLPTFDVAIVASATETSEGVVERATDVEAGAGSDTTRYITPKHAKDNYGITFGNFGGLIESVNAGGAGITVVTTPKKIKEIVSAFTGTANIQFTLNSSSSPAGYFVYARIYKNGVATGTLRSIDGSNSVTYSEDISITVGDLIQIYGYKGSAPASGDVSNFRLCFYPKMNKYISTVNL